MYKGQASKQLKSYNQEFEGAIRRTDAGLFYRREEVEEIKNGEKSPY
jgi:hypothetical protein